MTVLTTRGKTVALEGLKERRALWANQPLPNNVSMPAGSPMVFACIGCGGPIWVPETWTSRPDCCTECAALVALGWLE